MSEQRNETDQQHMLHLVESAQRAGRSESEIGAIVEEAFTADAELEPAA